MVGILFCLFCKCLQEFLWRLLLEWGYQCREFWAKILGSSDEEISTKLEIYQLSLKEKKVLSTIEEIKKNTQFLRLTRHCEEFYEIKRQAICFRQSERSRRQEQDAFVSFHFQSCFPTRFLFLDSERSQNESKNKRAQDKLLNQG